MRDYELVYIAPPIVEDEQVGAVTETIATYVRNLKGELGEVKPWGRRKFAYPINHYREGNYVELHFRLDPAAAHELERSLRLNESVLRYLLVRKDEK